MKAGTRKAPWLAAVALLAMTVGASGYYPFVHYTSGSSPYGAAAEKFDLDGLPGHTVFYFVSSRGPEVLAAGDSFTSVLSQIRMAAKAWSGVETSELRFEFGGLSTGDVEQTTPGVDVYFGEVELPPGLIALGGPTSRASLTTSDTGLFIPITRSILVLGKDLSQRPSHSDAFFLTVLHELGHALGLQHTLTSAAMSTEITRAVTRANPLAADDIAGISLLYPTAAFAEKTGSISGRVTLGGAGVHLASVVALDPAGSAVSALSDPDGSYVIRGLSPGQYYLYVHPLPPALQAGLGPADIVLPVGPDGRPVAAGPLFETIFYPAVKDVAGADIVTVKVGKVAADLDFAVQARQSLDVYSVTTYSFPGLFAVKPAFLNANGTRRWLVAYGTGLMSGGAPAAGLRVQALGNGAAVTEDGLNAYAPSPVFLQIGFGYNPFSGEGPRHLVFTREGNIFVLPAAFHLVRSQPPAVASVTPGVDGEGPVAVIAGSNLTEASRVLFDGYPATIRSMNGTTGALTVRPPVGTSGHRAVVNVLDPDGQDSLFMNPTTPLAYTYPAASATAMTMTPSALAAGAESMVEITGAGTRFTEGETVAGFGSSDIVVRGVWALSQTRLLANVHVAASASQTPAPLTVATGFQVATLASALQVLPANSAMPIVNPEAVNPNTGQPSVYAGGKAAVAVTQLAPGLTAASIAVSVNGSGAPVLSLKDGVVTFAVPSGVDLGPAVLRLTAGGQQAAPIVIVIDSPPPVIVGVTNLSGLAIGASRPATVGESLLVTVTGLADDRVLMDLSRLVIRVGGVPQTAVTIGPSRTEANGYEVRFAVSGVTPAAAVSVTVAIGPRVSQPVSIPVRAAI